MVGLLILLISLPIGIYLARQTQQAQSRASEQTSVPSGQIDDRFALATPECDLVKELGVPWYYHWGHGGGYGSNYASGYANKDEENCRAQGVNSFYTLGKKDNTEYYINGTRSMDPNHDFSEEHKNQFLKDATDRANYQTLKNFLNTWFSDEGRARDNNIDKDHSLDSFLRIPEYTSKTPGAVYGIGNEPDWGPYYDPADYAQLYHIYYTQVKKYDPTAKVMVKGLVGSVTEYGETYCVDSSADGRYDPENNCENGQHVRFKWINKFREAYRARYGSYPVVDIWGIHPYTNVQTFKDDPENSWNDGKDKIIAFREYLNSIGEGNKPVWLLEFGVQGSHGYIMDSRDPQHKMKEAELIADKYMKPILEWLKSTNYAQKWFWYSALRDENSTFVSDISAVNKLGQVYKEYLTKAPFVPTPANNSSPFGHFDDVDRNTCTVYGWAADPDTYNPIQVDIYVGGPAGRGGRWVAKGPTNVPRRAGEVIPPISRFIINLPNELKDGLDHDIYLYAIDPQPGNNNPLLPGSPKRINCGGGGGGGGGGTGVVGVILQHFGQQGNSSQGDQNSDNKVNELDFGAVYSR